MTTLQYNYKIYNDEYFDNLRVGNLTASNVNTQTLTTGSATISGTLTVSGLSLGATTITDFSQIGGGSTGATGASGLQGATGPSGVGATGATGPAGTGTPFIGVLEYNTGFGTYSNTNLETVTTRGIPLNATNLSGGSTSFGIVGKGESRRVPDAEGQTQSVDPVIQLENDTSTLINIAPRDMLVTGLTFEVSNPGPVVVNQNRTSPSTTSTLFVEVTLYVEDLDFVINNPGADPNFVYYTRTDLSGSVVLVSDVDQENDNVYPAYTLARQQASDTGAILITLGTTYMIMANLRLAQSDQNPANVLASAVIGVTASLTFV